MKRFEPMMVLAVAVLIGVVFIGVSSLMRPDQILSEAEIALLSAIVGAVAGASLPMSARQPGSEPEPEPEPVQPDDDWGDEEGFDK